LELEDGNSGNVSKQLKEEHIPQFETNFNVGLVQYLRHLSKEEALPYISLLDENGLIKLGIKERTKDKVIRKLLENINTILVTVVLAVISLLLGLPI
jgi:hypothetical protein